MATAASPLAAPSPYAKPGPYKTDLGEDEPKFQSWVKSNKIPWQDGPQSDYDMRGYWKAQQGGDSLAKTSINPVDKKPHYPDTYKTPYHKTFSNESQYALPTAPHWEGQNLVPTDGATATAPTTDILDDPDFQNLNLEDKHKALMATKPEYAALPPKNQAAALKEIHYGPDPEVPSNNERQANSFLLGTASGASQLPETEHPLVDAAKSLVTGWSTHSNLPEKPTAEQLNKLGNPPTPIGELISPTGANEDPEDAMERRAHGAGTLTGMAGTGMIGEGVSRAPEAAAKVGEVRGRIGDTIHDPETGNLTPSAERKAQFAGGAIGATGGGAYGLITGHPYGAMGGAASGAYTGARLAPGLMETMFPESEARVAARTDPYAVRAAGPELPKNGLPPAKPGPYDVRAAGPEVPKGGLPSAKPETESASEPIGSRISGGSSPDDLISRTRKLVVPGEEPTAADVKRAGDLTQAPIQRLKDLAKFGDKLAQNEINRRLKNQ